MIAKIPHMTQTRFCSKIQQDFSIKFIMDGNLIINVRSSADLRFSLSIAQPGALETTIVAIKSMIKDNNGVETTAQVRPAGVCELCETERKGSSQIAYLLPN